MRGHSYVVSNYDISWFWSVITFICPFSIYLYKESIENKKIYIKNRGKWGQIAKIAWNNDIPLFWAIFARGQNFWISPRMTIYRYYRGDKNGDKFVPLQNFTSDNFVICVILGRFILYYLIPFCLKPFCSCCLFYFNCFCYFLT